MSWMAISIIGTGVGVGGREYSKYKTAKDAKKFQEDNPPEFLMAPEFPETVKAREGLSGKLEEWGDDPMYGGVPQDWGEIWNLAKQKTRDFYWGTATGPGAADKVKASAARRGVSDSPALEAQLAAMSASEGRDLRKTASEQSISRAEFGEAGRLNWMTAMGQMADRKPSGMWNTKEFIPQYNWGDAIGAGGETVGSLASMGAKNKQADEQNKWMRDYLEKNRQRTPGRQELWG